MTLPLEHVQDGDWAALNRVIDKLRSLVPDTGGSSVGIRWGIGTVTWPGGQSLSAANTIAHGLGTDPAAIAITPIAAAGDGAGFSAQVTAGAVGGVSFDVRLGVDSFSPVAGTQRSFYWIVIG
jgi:hypothetical protein